MSKLEKIAGQVATLVGVIAIIYFIIYNPYIFIVVAFFGFILMGPRKVIREIMDLQIFNKKFYKDGRELLFKARLMTPYKIWMPEKIERFGLVEGKDYTCKTSVTASGEKSNEYFFTKQSANKILGIKPITNKEKKKTAGQVVMLIGGIAIIYYIGPKVLSSILDVIGSSFDVDGSSVFMLIIIAAWAIFFGYIFLRGLFKRKTE